MAQRRGVVGDPGDGSESGPVSKYVRQPDWMLGELAELSPARVGRSILVWRVLWNLRTPVSTDPALRGVWASWPGARRLADDCRFGLDAKPGEDRSDRAGTRSVTSAVADLVAINAVVVVPWQRADGSPTSPTYVMYEAELGYDDLEDPDRPNTFTRFRQSRDVPYDELGALRYGEPVPTSKVEARRRAYKAAVQRRVAGPVL